MSPKWPVGNDELDALIEQAVDAYDRLAATDESLPLIRRRAGPMTLSPVELMPAIMSVEEAAADLEPLLPAGARAPNFDRRARLEMRFGDTIRWQTTEWAGLTAGSFVTHRRALPPRVPLRGWRHESAALGPSRSRGSHAESEKELLG